MAQVRAKVIIRGRVQGGGYRYNTQKEAQKLNLTGWCRNNPDASVGALFEGERKTIEAMLRWCWQGPLMARVDDIQVTWTDASGEFSSFNITG